MPVREEEKHRPPHGELRLPASPVGRGKPPGGAGRRRAAGRCRRGAAPGPGGYKEMEAAGRGVAWRRYGRGEAGRAGR